MLSIGSNQAHRLTNNPIHFQDDEGNLFPTALVPFCGFGGNMSVMGVKIDQFNVSVCNSFRPKIIKDQLCYTVDPNKYKDKIDTKGELSLSLFIHYNEDRKINFDDIPEANSIIINTIGKMICIKNKK